MKTILLITILAISTFTQSFTLYRVTHDNKQKIALFKDQDKKNWYNCYYVKDLIEKDDYLAVESKKRTYECVIDTLPVPTKILLMVVK